MADSAFSTLHYRVENHIAHLVLDRPPANLIDRKSTLELHCALGMAAKNSDARVVVLSGKGKGLSGGVDLNYLASFGATEMRDFLRLFYVETLDVMRELGKPAIAAVHGYAREGACTLAFACDMIIAADDASFGYPGVPNLAAPPGMHVWFLQKLIGRMRAAELIFTGDPVNAEEAARLGLITRVVPTRDLQTETLRLASRIAAMSPLALRRTREALYRMESMDYSAVPEAALEALASAFDSEDSREARRAFLEKRAPRWVGR